MNHAIRSRKNMTAVLPDQPNATRQRRRTSLAASKLAVKGAVLYPTRTGTNPPRAR